MQFIIHNYKGNQNGGDEGKIDIKYLDCKLVFGRLWHSPTNFILASTPIPTIHQFQARNNHELSCILANSLFFHNNTMMVMIVMMIFAKAMLAMNNLRLSQINNVRCYCVLNRKLKVFSTDSLLCKVKISNVEQ